MWEFFFVDFISLFLFQPHSDKSFFHSAKFQLKLFSGSSPFQSCGNLSLNLSGDVNMEVNCSVQPNMASRLMALSLEAVHGYFFFTNCLFLFFYFSLWLSLFCLNGCSEHQVFVEMSVSNLN